jgi:aspartyl-tRNA(Asn)/glutamyl-tRNA(Gln) amidotransferase subunit C
MKVSEKDVAYVAELANLDLTSHEREGMLRDLNSILDYVDLLNEVDTSSVQPMSQVSVHQQASDGAARTPSIADESREDILEGLRPSLAQDVALANAPDADGTFFRVPKVIER